MREWLLKSPMFSWAYRQGGIDSFPLAQKDILETFNEDLERRANELSEQKMAQMLSNIDPSLVITVDPRTRALLIGGEKPDAVMISNLKAEVDFLTESQLWKLLYETPKALAERAMFVDDGKLENQLLKGRAILFTLATQKKIVDTLKAAIVPTSSTMSTGSGVTM